MGRNNVASFKPELDLNSRTSHLEVTKHHSAILVLGLLLSDVHLYELEKLHKILCHN